MKLTLQWVKPPANLLASLTQYQYRVLVALHALAAYVGQAMQDDGRAKARWADRTGNARSGLFFAVDGLGQRPVTGTVTTDPALNTDQVALSGSKDLLVLAFGHTVFYGKALELEHGGRYAVVMSTMQRRLPELERLLKELFR